MDIKIGAFMICLSSAVFSNNLHAMVMPTSHKACDIFATWRDDASAAKQHVWPQVLLRRQQKGFIDRFNATFKPASPTYKIFAQLLSGSPETVLADTPAIKKQVAAFYKKLNTDPAGLIAQLQRNGFKSEELNVIEKKKRFQTVINRNMKLAYALAGGKDDAEHEHALFSLAQRLYFHLFDEGWKKTNLFFEQPHHFPVLRFLYSIVWQSLAGSGWKEWSAECLAELAKIAAAGKTVRYIAGGCDISQLVNAGVYSIDIIDPMLPTQPRYYVDQWDWFVGGNDEKHALGDSIIFENGVTMVRADFQPDAVRTLSLTMPDGTVTQVPESITSWDVKDKDNKTVGTIRFLRRFCNQDDFNVSPQHELLISFNELHFITCADDENWGISPHKFDNKLRLYVKQLHKPVSAQMAKNLNSADAKEFSFIQLGSCVK